MANDWTRAMLGTRAKLLGVIGAVVLLVLVAPAVLLVFGLLIPAVVCVLAGLLGLAVVVTALLPGRRRWR